MSSLSNILLKRSECNAVGMCAFHENLCKVGHSLLMGTSEDNGCACTMKVYDILKVKNALSLSMYFVRE